MDSALELGPSQPSENALEVSDPGDEDVDHSVPGPSLRDISVQCRLGKTTLQEGG